MGLPNVSLETAVPYVAAAYIGIWVILFGYLIALGGKLSGLRRQVDALSDAVKSRTAKAEAASGDKAFEKTEVKV
jgi:CcmD family protein